MPTGPTRKYDYEKGKRRDAVTNPDYFERFKEEGDRFDRGGEKWPKVVISRGGVVHFDRRPFIMEDKLSVIRPRLANRRQDDR